MGMPHIPQQRSVPPIPTAVDPLVMFARLREQQKAQARQGRSSTILASGNGTATPSLATGGKLGGGY